MEGRCEVGYDVLHGHLVVLSRIPAVHLSCQGMLDFRILHHVTQDDFGFEQQVLESLSRHIVSPASQDDLPVIEFILARLR